MTRDTSVLSQKFVAEGVRVEAEIPKPRQGRYRVAHGVRRCEKINRRCHSERSEESRPKLGA
jgi:hypothetical protein